MFSVRYINMCIEAKSEVEYVRIISASRDRNYMPDFNFESGDYFHHTDMGMDEVREAVQVILAWFYYTQSIA